jgi:hypothetical protein
MSLSEHIVATITFASHGSNGLDSTVAFIIFVICGFSADVSARDV